jgi:hypothetical protein
MAPLSFSLPSTLPEIQRPKQRAKHSKPKPRKRKRHRPNPAVREIYDAFDKAMERKGDDWTWPKG